MGGSNSSGAKCAETNLGSSHECRGSHSFPNAGILPCCRAGNSSRSRHFVAAFSKFQITFCIGEASSKAGCGKDLPPYHAREPRAFENDAALATGACATSGSSPLEAGRGDQLLRSKRTRREYRVMRESKTNLKSNFVQEVW